MMDQKRPADCELDDMMECSICTEAFTNPRVLPCIHTFCLHCLVNYGKDRQPGDTMPCPLCRKKFTIPRDGMAGMQKNFFAETFLRSKKKKMDIHSCEAHNDEAARAFCLECKQAMCMNCFAEAHSSHEWCDNEQHKRIKTDTDKVTEDLKKTRELLPSIEKEKDDLTNQLADTENEINKTVDNVIAAAELERTKLLSEVASIRQKRVKQLETLTEEVEQHMVALESFRQKGETLLSSATGCDVRRSAKSFHDRADELATTDIIGRVQSSLPHATVKLTTAIGVNGKRGNLIGEISEDGKFTAPTVAHIIPKGNTIGALTLLGDDIFVVRWSTPHVEVYDAATFALRRCLKVPKLGSNPYGMAACAVNKCLYVSDWDNNAVHRVAISTSWLSWTNASLKWSVARCPVGVSVNSAQNVLVVCSYERKLQEFTTSGSLVREIQLQPDIERPWHIVQLSADRFLVSHQAPEHRVCMVDNNGSVVRSYGGPPGSDMTKLNRPEGLAVDKYGNVLVADFVNNRLLVLDQSLGSAHEMPVSVDGRLVAPCALCYDESRRRLYVGEWTGGRVVVIDNVKAFSRI